MKTVGFAQGLYEVSSIQKEELGMLRIEPDGRKFRYAKAGAVALSPGKVTSMLGVTAHHINRAGVVAADIGDIEVQVTVAGTAVTADQYKDGYLQINDGTGEGHSYGIDTNTACDASGTTIVTLKDPIQVALLGSSSTEISLIPNPWSGTVIQATEATGSAGIPLKDVPISNYYWSQTGGVGIAFAKGTDAMGSWQEHGDTDGTVDIANGYDKFLVGFVIATANVAAEYKPIWLTID